MVQNCFVHPICALPIHPREENYKRLLFGLKHTPEVLVGAAVRMVYKYGPSVGKT